MEIANHINLICLVLFKCDIDIKIGTKLNKINKSSRYLKNARNNFNCFFLVCHQLFSFTGIAQERTGRYAQTLQNLQELQITKEQHPTTPQKIT